MGATVNFEVTKGPLRVDIGALFNPRIDALIRSECPVII